MTDIGLPPIPDFLNRKLAKPATPKRRQFSQATLDARAGAQGARQCRALKAKWKKIHARERKRRRNEKAKS